MGYDVAFGINIGVVIIGRNEGARLKVCLESVDGLAEQIVYVDSGSTDESVGMARGMGVEVVKLDMSIPFTAARARNEGFERLLGLQPKIRYVQFVDGDCEVIKSWPEKAIEFLDKHKEVAVVCGRRRERFPDRTVYNLLCDIEWDTQVGEAKACGGDSLMRVEAFRAIKGFNAGLIAGEEPELCVRLRQAGWKIWRLGEEMTLHDAAITKFSQWWRRSIRGGYAFAQGTYLHGSPPERHCVRQSLRIWFWGLGLPLLAIFLSVLFGFVGAWLLAIYPLQMLRLLLRGRFSLRVNTKRAFFLVLGKFPEVLGQLKFVIDRFIGKKSQIIEYK